MIAHLDSCYNIAHFENLIMFNMKQKSTMYYTSIAYWQNFFPYLNCLLLKYMSSLQILKVYCVIFFFSLCAQLSLKWLKVL